MAEIVQTEPFLDVFEELTPRDQALIDDKVRWLRSFPRMYPIRDTGPRPFRGLRYSVAGHWLVYYSYKGETGYLRMLWPTRIPYSEHESSKSSSS
jgi:hypothetical protein